MVVEVDTAAAAAVVVAVIENAGKPAKVVQTLTTRQNQQRVRSFGCTRCV